MASLVSASAGETTTTVAQPRGELLLTQLRALDKETLEVVETEPNDDFDTATTIQPGELIEGQLGPGNVDFYVFTGQAGSQISVTLDRESDVGVVALVVYGSDRQFLTGQFVGNGQPAVVTLTAATSGPHYVQVIDVESGVGFYTLTVGGTTPSPEPVPDPGDSNEPNNGPASATPLAVGETKEGTVDSTTDEDWFAWQRVGDTAQIFVARDLTGSGTITVQALDPNGSPIQFRDSDGNTFSEWPLSPGEDVTFTFSDLLPGTYHLIIASGADEGTGPYTVTYESSGPGSSAAESGTVDREDVHVANDTSTSQED